MSTLVLCCLDRIFYHTVETEDVCRVKQEHDDSTATLLKGNHDQHVLAILHESQKYFLSFCSISMH